MPTLNSSSGLRDIAAHRHVPDLPDLRGGKNARRAGALEYVFVGVCAILLSQLIISGWLNLKTWPGSAAVILGLAATATLVIARFDVSFVRLFCPRKRDEVEHPPLPWWLSQSLTIAIVVIIAGLGPVLFGLAGLSFTGIAATATSSSRWVWIAANILLLAAVLAWRASSKR
jgi:hypothetical protein